MKNTQMRDINSKSTSTFLFQIYSNVRYAINLLLNLNTKSLYIQLEAGFEVVIFLERIQILFLNTLQEDGAFVVETCVEKIYRDLGTKFQI